MRNPYSLMRRLPAGREVNEEPSLLGLLVPARTYIRFDAIFLPDLCPAIPLLPFLVDEVLKATPATPTLAPCTLPMIGMLLALSQQVMPVAITAQLHQPR